MRDRMQEALKRSKADYSEIRIEEKESTLIVGEDTSVSVDGFGFLWVDIKEGKVEGAPRKKGLEVGGKRSRLK